MSRTFVTPLLILLLYYAVPSVATAQPGRFRDMPEGVVLDGKLNAFWMKSSKSGHSIEAAQQYAKGLKKASWADWRLPTTSEIRTLLAPSGKGVVPIINLDGNSVWTSDTKVVAGKTKRVTYDFAMNREILTDSQGFQEGASESDHPRTLLIRSRYRMEVRVSIVCEKTNDDFLHGSEDELYAYHILAQDKRSPEDPNDLRFANGRLWSGDVNKSNKNRTPGDTLVWEGELMPNQQVSFFYTLIEKDNQSLSNIASRLVDIQREWTAKYLNVEAGPIGTVMAGDIFIWMDKNYLYWNPTGWFHSTIAKYAANDHIGTFYVTMMMGSDRVLRTNIKPVKDSKFLANGRLELNGNGARYYPGVTLNNNPVGQKSTFPFH